MSEPLVVARGSRRVGLVERPCERCSQSFMVERRKMRRGQGRFCSRACSASHVVSVRHATVGQRGALNGNWKGGVSQSPARYTRRFKVKFPEKARAQRLAQQAVRAGSIERPHCCSSCGVACVPHGHHDDYARPLAVRWLCRSCHIAHHAAVRRSHLIQLDSRKDI